jgi:hypothetical protein
MLSKIPLEEPEPEEAEPGPDQINVAANATSLDFLRAVYRDARQPMPRRMKAAEVAIAFEHPKLSVVATLNSFASRLETMMEARGMRTVIDAEAKALGPG